MRMAKRRIWASVVALGTVAGACAVHAQQEPAKTTGEKIGDRFREAGQDVERGAKKVGAGVRDGWDRAKTSVHNMGVEGRVYGRLHWDKQLQDASLEVEMREAGTVILKGTVPSEAAKTKALALANETAGVTTVVDQLGIVAPVDIKTTTTTTTKVKVTPKPGAPKP